MKLWHVAEEEGVSSDDPRANWFPKKEDAVNCQKKWLGEHSEVVEEGVDVSELVKLERIEIPTSRDALARWLYAYEVKVI